MKISESKNIFENFKKEWLDVDRIFFYGASKDYVQLIETLDLILKKKINDHYVIDDFAEGKYNNIYSINSSSYKPDGLVKANKRKVKIISFQDYVKQRKDNDKIIICSDANKNEYINKLSKSGLKANKDFIDYKIFGGLLPFFQEKLLHVWRTDILLTEKCTLNCTFCNMYMPHYKKPKHKELKNVLNDLETYFKFIDYVSIFHLVGGEPLMYPHIDDVIEFIGLNYRDKIGRFLITTNGTLTPKETTIEFLKKFKVLVSISDYTDEIKYERRLNLLLDKLKNSNVEHFVRKDIEWSDFGHPEKTKFSDEKTILKHFNKCTAPYKGLNDGKYYYCHLNTSANLAGLVPVNENDYFDFKKENENNKLGFLEHDLGFFKTWIFNVL